MEITEGMQQVLTCEECNELLSCGPVYLVHGTSAAVCGRCSPQTREEREEEEKVALTSNSSNGGGGRSRNLQYEALARQFFFPCQFASHGCQEKMEFSSQEPNSHERHCPFRPFICPIAERGSCDRIGSHQKLREHCEEAHPDHVLASPCLVPRPDLTKSHLKNYLVSAYNFLFLLQLKVCITSGKLWHAVRMFGGTEFLENFSYSLEIEGNDNKLTQKRPVIVTGLMMLQEPTATCMSINTLLSALSGQYEETKFTITINTTLNFNCVHCLKHIVSNSQYCNDCKLKLVKCGFNSDGCLFVDVNKYKCVKHKQFFCKFQTKCFKCHVSFVAGSFLEHFGSSTSCRKVIKAKLNSVIHVTQTALNYTLLSSDNFGTIICTYSFGTSSITIYLYSSLPFKELKKLKSCIELKDPQTNYVLTRTPEIVENMRCDWKIEEDLHNFPSLNQIGIDLKINITKID